MEKISKEAINNMEEDLNKTRNELEQKSFEKIKALESEMIAKDTEIMNEIKKDQPLLSTEEPIPEMCKYIYYKMRHQIILCLCLIRLNLQILKLPF